MQRFPTLFYLLPLLLLMACDPTDLLGPSVKRAENYQLRARYERGPCFGRCEVFNLSVYENGLLVFEGERFTERPGTWQRTIDRRQLTDLLAAMEQANFEGYPAVIRGMIPDYPSVTVTYYDADGRDYTTTFKDEAPDELQRISQQLNDLANLEGYRQVSDTINNSLIRPTALKEREEIIVQLQRGVMAEAWVIKYGKQNVTVKERIAPASPYWIILADPNVMAADELLEYIRQDREVVSAQLNRSVGPR